jgi:hypothetical protein
MPDLCLGPATLMTLGRRPIAITGRLHTDAPERLRRRLGAGGMTGAKTSGADGVCSGCRRVTRPHDGDEILATCLARCLRISVGTWSCDRCWTSHGWRLGQETEQHDPRGA